MKFLALSLHDQRRVYLELLLTVDWKSFDCSEQVSKTAEYGFRRESQTVAAMTKYRTKRVPFPAAPRQVNRWRFRIG